MFLSEQTLAQCEPEKEHEGETCIPAFSHSFFTPFYDFMMKYAARESTFKPQLVKQANIKKDQRILDIGCGTATLTILVKKVHPESQVIGLDADPKILEVARSKIARANVNISLDYGTATELPYPNNFFDRVFFSMVLHHLDHEDKVRALKEAFRVLRPEGELHVADLGKPHNFIMFLVSLIIGRLEETSDNIEGWIPRMIRKAGFVEVEETARHMTMFGTIALYRA